MSEDKKCWFDFTKVKWFFTEISKIYSSEPSYFSKKRIESGIGFIIAEWGMIFFLLKKIDTMTMMEFGAWASIQFIVAGYMVNKIEAAKKDTLVEESTEPQSEVTDIADSDIDPSRQ